MNWKYLFIFLLFCGFLSGCGSHKNAKKNIDKPKPCTIVYKTKADYSQLVPIKLNVAKTRVEGFPAPSDLYRFGQLSTPVALGNGYLLDRQGISVNSAFLSVTYEEYKRFRNTPNPSWLMENIKDKNPFTEFYCIDIEPLNIDTLKHIMQEKFKDSRAKRLL